MIRSSVSLALAAGAAAVSVPATARTLDLGYPAAVLEIASWLQWRKADSQPAVEYWAGNTTFKCFEQRVADMVNTSGVR